MKTFMIRNILLGLCILGLVTGCMSKEERAKQVVERAVEKCRSGEGDFVNVHLYDGATRRVLRQACLESVEDAQMRTEWSATVNTGPLVWMAGVDKDTSAWVLTGVEWEDLDRARRLRADTDATDDVLARAEGFLKSAQETFPASDWIRVERLKNLLELRGKSRANDDPAPATIGDQAQGYYEELLAWAADEDRAEIAAQARLMVVEHLQNYLRRQQSGLNAIGSRDERLEISIEEALKEGDRALAAEIRQDLAERRERAVTDRVVITERIEAAQRNICKEIATLTATGVSDNDLRGRITNTLNNIDCSATAQQDE